MGIPFGSLARSLVRKTRSRDTFYPTTYYATDRSLQKPLVPSRSDGFPINRRQFSQLSYGGSQNRGGISHPCADLIGL